MPEERRVSLRIIKTELPEDIKGVCSVCSDGSYLILINQDLDEREQEASFLHEMLHIYHNDFDSDMSIHEIENKRHGMRAV